jgi:hypothetical protein
MIGSWATLCALHTTCQVHQRIRNAAALQAGVRPVQLGVRLLHNARPKHVGVTAGCEHQRRVLLDVTALPLNVFAINKIMGGPCTAEKNPL